ncbi:hypothetical protein C7974DRAFT_74101 [Boeremia exigua]|uniref:uncharacterized protein n=1 Tax=Boeremia exigua TaxID=749465 RepID=UPI001E8E8421|nr:uncharacterized protein C7974DRAFT_74101 [Boeremia exigua]KAH6614309.1 hypothetical protein C7974DRAFT_74101 [Boeremia exigua]
MRRPGTHKATDTCRDVAFESVQTVEKLTRVLGTEQTTSVFFLKQSSSWSRLCISEEHFRRLFTRLVVHPSFLDVVHLFSEKIGPVEEGFSSFFVHVSPSSDTSTMIEHNCSYHIGYNIKYVAKHGRKYPNDPFVVRECGVYQHFSSSTQQSSWIFIQASDHFKDRFRRTFQSCSDTLPEKQFLLHSMLLLDVSEDWRDYLIYLEEQFSKIVDKGFFTNTKGPQREGDITADFSDLRRLHILTDKLQRLAHILKLNIRLGNNLKREMTRIAASSSSVLRMAFDGIQAKLNEFLLAQETSKDRVETLISRSGGISQLVQSIQDIRSTEASRLVNCEMQRLTEQGIKENQLMKKLTEQSTKDTRSMMAIALISAIFLPATFLATLFGSNFFAFSDTEGVLTVASNFWVYIVFTSAFSGATVLTWFLWRRRKLRRHDTGDEVEML